MPRPFLANQPTNILSLQTTAALQSIQVSAIQLMRGTDRNHLQLITEIYLPKKAGERHSTDEPDTFHPGILVEEAAILAVSELTWRTSEKMRSRIPK